MPCPSFDPIMETVVCSSLLLCLSHTCLGTIFSLRAWSRLGPADPGTTEPDLSTVEASNSKPEKANAEIPVTQTGLSLTLTTVEADNEGLKVFAKTPTML